MNKREKRALPDIHDRTKNSKYSISTRSGYVLLVTLMLIALGIAIIATVVQRSISYQRITRVTLEREKARMLALGGLQIALAQVSFIDDDKPEQTSQQNLPNQPNQPAEPQEQSTLKADQRWLLQVLPLLNTWQQFAFTQEKDKLEGQLSVYISSEQGKFDLVKLLEGTTSDKNQEQNQEQEQGKEKKEKEQLKLYINEQLEKHMGGVKPIDVAQQMQKQLGRALEDPTELLHNKSMQAAFQDKLFVHDKKQESKSDKKALYLTDIFTTRSRSGKLNPWFISASVGTLVELQVKGARDMQKWQQAVKRWQPKVNWAAAWDTTLKDIYGKAYQALPQALRDNLDPEFEAPVFLAISSATVGTVTQTVAALMQQSDFLSQSFVSKSGPGQLRKPESRIFALIKLYWL